MMLAKTQKSSRGFSLLELLLVVAVGSVLILSGLGAYRLVSENSNSNTATTQVTTLKQQVQQAFAGQGSYGAANADLSATLNNLRALPSDMPVTGTNLRNAFGTTTTVTVGAATNQFRITFNGVPRSACVKLGQLFTPANASDFVSLTVGTTAVATFTIAGLTTACSAATNNMAWVFQ